MVKNKTRSEKIGRLLRAAILIFCAILTFKIIFDNINTKENTESALWNIKEEEKEELLELAHKTTENYFSGEDLKKIEDSEVPENLKIDNKVFVTIRTKGKARGCRAFQSSNLLESVRRATIRAIEDKNYNKPLSEADISNVRIDISILAPYENFDPISQKITDFIEPGIHGIRIDHHQAKGSAYYLPYVQTEKNYKTTKLLSRLCKKAKLAENCFDDPLLEIKRFKTLHLIDSTREFGKVVELYRNSQLLDSKKIDAELIYERLGLLSKWFKENIKNTGELPYLYYPSNGNYPNSDNVIRQLLTSQGIFALARQMKDPELESIAYKHLNYLLEQYYIYDENQNLGYFERNEKVKLGAAALGIIAILESPQPELYRDKLDALVNFLLYMQQVDGSFQTFYKPIDFETNQRFYSGEALTAAAKLYEYTDDPKWLTFIEKSFEYYRSYLSETYLPQFVPWHTFAYTTAYQATGDNKYAEFVLTLNDRLVAEMLVTDPNYPDQLGRFFNAKYPKWGPPHSASTSVYVEGLAYAYRIAEEKNDLKRKNNYKKAILLGTRSLLQLQWTPETTYYLQHPERVLGTFKRTTNRNEFRIDQVGHTANAITQALTLKILDN